MISDSAARAFAEQLRDAEVDGTAAPLASDTFPDLDVGGARAIARARDELRRSDGEVLIGYKLGWTSAAMRAALGIDRPNWGTLWQSQHLDGQLATATLRHAKVEPEIVYVADAELSGTEVTSGDVISSGAGWAIGIEVVHPRWKSFDFTWLDNTADNSSSAAIAVGPKRQIGVEPAALDVTFSDGADTQTGRGDLAMGDPAEAVAWLARQLAREGLGIERGQIVFTGGLTAPFDVSHGSRFTASCAELGDVAITTADS
ncbi:2-keto-4-pentenoate hydratase [Ilumatobacter sp.]|uniref:2-keto-4-pentenoate hydratase n=1 Tax=Ilumatobacter sp. TaxID=1967498 RepID=UPI003B52006F